MVTVAEKWDAPWEEEGQIEMGYFLERFAEKEWTEVTDVALEGDGSASAALQIVPSTAD